MENGQNNTGIKNATCISMIDRIHDHQLCIALEVNRLHFTVMRGVFFALMIQDCVHGNVV